MADDDGPILLAACKRANVSLLKKLIEDHGDAMDPNSVDGLGNGPLHYAAAGDHIEIAQLLMERYGSKVNVNLQNFAGDTALHKAVAANHLEFVEFLLEHGALTTLRNKQGREPTALAIDPEARELIRQAQLGSISTQNNNSHFTAAQVRATQATNTTTSTGTTGGASTPEEPLPVVKAELDPTMIADADDTDD